MEVEAIVLAGRPNDGKLASESSEAWEANIDIAGKPMAFYILDVLERMPSITKIHLVGPDEPLAGFAKGKVSIVAPGGGLFDNVRIGLDAVSSEYALVCASDVPLLTLEIMEGLMTRFFESGADFCYPVSEKADCERAYPGVRRTYLSLREGTYTGGNIFFAKKSAASDAWPMVQKMISYRKSPLKMAAQLGPWLLLRTALKVARVRELEDRLGRILNIGAKAILDVHPAIGVDVDKPSDLELCRRILGK